MAEFERQFFQYFQNFKNLIKASPLVLGGYTSTSGGGGGPPGGFLGLLPQTRIAYDLSEAEVASPIGSGSLMDNLNHIRYRLYDLESTGPGGGGNLSIYSVGTLVASGVTIVDFDNHFSATETTPHHIDIVLLSGGGGGTPSDTVVALDGVSTAGALTTYSRGDHKHGDVNRHGHNKILLLKRSGGDPVEYEVTSAGLDAAITASVANDIILLPACSIPGNHTIKVGTEVRGVGTDKSILSGVITYTNATLSNLYANSSDMIYKYGPNAGLEISSSYAYILGRNFSMRDTVAGISRFFYMGASEPGFNYWDLTFRDTGLLGDLYYAGDLTYSQKIDMYRYTDTGGNPLDNQQIFDIIGQGQTGIRFMADENHSVGHAGTRTEIYATTPSTTTSHNVEVVYGDRVEFLEPIIIPSGTIASGGAAGQAGQLSWDGNYIYVCVSTNNWKRANLSGW